MNRPRPGLADLLPWLGGLLPAALLLHRVGRGGMLFGSDVVLNFYYSRAMAAEALAEGRLLLWDPHTLCGFPHFAALQGGLLYPLTWLTALLEPGWSWTVLVALHLVLAHVFAYGWLRRGCGFGAAGSVAGAWLFACSPYLVTHAYGGHVALVAAYPWSAAALWAFEALWRRPSPRAFLGLCAAVAIQFLAGYPEMTFFTALLLGARLLGEIPVASRQKAAHRLLLLLLALVAAGLLVAPQLLASLELVRHTTRSAGTASAFASSFALPPENLLLLLAPDALGNHAEAPYWGRWLYWEVCPFLGRSALVLAVLGAGSTRRGRILWAVVAAAGLLMALGPHTPVFGIAYRLVPGVDLFRAPGRYLYLVLIACAWLAAAGTDRLATCLREDRDGLLRRHGRRWILLGAALLGVLLLAYEEEGGQSIAWRHLLALSFGQGDRLGPVRVDAAFLDGTYRQAWRSMCAAGLLLLAAGGALLAGGRWRNVRRALPALLVGALAAELAVFAWPFFGSADRAAQGWPAPLAKRLREASGTWRLTGVGDSRAIGRAQYYGADHGGGNDPLLLRRYAELVNTAAGRPAREPLVVAEPASPGPLRRLLGLRYCVVQQGYPPPPGYRPAGRYGRFLLFEDPEVLPRASFVPAAQVVSSAAKRLEALSRPGFDPARVVLLETPVPGLTDPIEAGEDAAVRMASHGPGMYAVDVETPGEGFLRLSESWYPGWRVEVDGAERKLLRADHAFQAVRLKAGSHRVVFRYAPTWRGWGLLLFLAGMALCLGTVYVSFFRRPAVVLPSKEAC